jgi:hypothetical protein
MGGMEEMMAGMNIPKNSRVDANAMERRAKYQTISGRLKSKLDEKRKSAEVESIENGYSIEKTSDKNDFVFKLNKDGEAQPKTSLKQPAAAAAPKEEAWLEELIADQSSRRQHRPETQGNQEKKKNKNRNNRGSQTNYIYLPLIYIYNTTSFESHKWHRSYRS